MTEQQPLLHMQGITKEYFGNRVLTDVCLDVNRGEVLGLVGENGAGKSTLMNILFGMSVIGQTGGYAGTISIDGKDVNFQNPFDALKAGIGMVHQEFSLIPGFTATENILLNGEVLQDNLVTKVFGPRLKTLNLPEMRAIAEKSIDLLGVEISPDTLVSEMPVGHKQFTELAREIHRPEMKLLVLDEPTAVLTESEAQVLLTSLRRLAASGIAIIFITHRLQEIRVGQVAPHEVRQRLFGPEIAPQDGEAELRRAQGAKEAHHHPEGNEEVGVRRAPDLISKLAQSVGRVEVTVGLPLDGRHVAGMERVPILRHEQEKQAVDQPQDLPIKLLRGKRAAPQALAELSIGAVGEEAAPKALDGLLHALA
jgi:ABC-type branched-subunit amino acid transport system ATPase component